MHEIHVGYLDILHFVFVMTLRVCENYVFNSYICTHIFYMLCICVSAIMLIGTVVIHCNLVVTL